MDLTSLTPEQRALVPATVLAAAQKVADAQVAAVVTPTPATPVVETPVKEESAAPLEIEKAPVEETVAEPQGSALEVPPAETPKPKPTTIEEVASEEMTKEGRYRTMVGIQREQGRLLRESRAEAETLRAEIAALKKQNTAGGPREDKSAAQPAPVLDPNRGAKIRAAVGEEEYADLVSEIRDQVLREVAPVRDEIGRVAKTVGATAQSQFSTQMEDLVHGWEAINDDPAFYSLLDDRIPGTTGTYRQAALQAYADKDALRMAEVFNVLIPQMGTEAPKPGVKPVVVPKLDKKKYSAPPATPAAGAKLEETVQTVKFSEKQKLAEDIRNGAYESRDPEQRKVLQAKMQKETDRINEAQRTGRLVPG